MHVNSFLFITLTALAVPAAPQGEPRPDVDQLQGKWVLAAVVHKGHLQDIPPEARTLRWEFENNRVRIAGKSGRQMGTFVLDPAHQALDLVMARTIKTRYLIGGDTLQVCLDHEHPAERPGSFTTRGTPWSLMVFRRERPDDPHEQAIARERQTLAGAWQLVAVERGGKSESFTPSDYVFREGEVALVQNGREVGAAPYHLEPLVNPRQIDMPRQGVFVPSIYKIEGDVLTICSKGPNEELPKNFTTAPGSGRMLTVLKRRPQQ